MGAEGFGGPPQGLLLPRHCLLIDLLGLNEFVFSLDCWHRGCYTLGMQFSKAPDHLRYEKSARALFLYAWDDAWQWTIEGTLLNIERCLTSKILRFDTTQSLLRSSDIRGHCLSILSEAISMLGISSEDNLDAAYNQEHLLRLKALALALFDELEGRDA